MHEPYYADLPHKEYDSERTVYSGVREELPHDLQNYLENKLPPLIMWVQTSTMISLPARQ